MKIAKRKKKCVRKIKTYNKPLKQNLYIHDKIAKENNYETLKKRSIFDFLFYDGNVHGIRMYENVRQDFFYFPLKGLKTFRTIINNFIKYNCHNLKWHIRK